MKKPELISNPKTGPAQMSNPKTGQLDAPEGCEFVQERMVPVRVSLGCSACKVHMNAYAQAPSLHKADGQPAPKALMYKCPSCGHQTRLAAALPSVMLVPESELEDSGGD